MSRKVPRRRHVRKTRNGRTIVRRHAMTIRGRRKYQAKRDWVGYQRVRQTQKQRWGMRSPVVEAFGAEVTAENRISGSRVGAEFFDEDRNERETIFVTNSEPIKQVTGEHVEGTPNAVIRITEADGDEIHIMRVSEPLDPMRPFIRRIDQES